MLFYSNRCGVTESIREGCAVGVAYTISDACKMKAALDHRGPDTEGLGRRNGHAIDLVRSYNNALSEQAYKSIFGGSGGFVDNGFPIVLHKKYTTMGQRDPEKILFASHPHKIGGDDTVYSSVMNGKVYTSHVVTRNASRALVHNGQINPDNAPCKVQSKTGCDSEILMLNEDTIGSEKLISELEDTYCIASINDKDEFVNVYRDRHGRMPLWLGKDSEGNFVAASEDYAIRQIGGVPLREVRPGELIRMYRDQMETKQIVKPDPLFCFVQLNYMGRKESFLLDLLRDAGIDLKALRSKLGEMLAMESPPESWVKFVTYIPNTPLDAAKAYARYLEIPFIELFYKTKQVRAFMQPDQAERYRVISSVMHISDIITPDAFGYDYLDVDDSTIRGTNAEVGVTKARDRGFRKIVHKSYSPMFGGEEEGVLLGCRSGVDIPPSDNFLAKRGNRDPVRMAELVGVDQMDFLSIEKMLDVYEECGLNRNNVCMECVSAVPRRAPSKILESRNI
jgi:amidophosphoribosyltransferase